MSTQDILDQGKLSKDALPIIEAKIKMIENEYVECMKNLSFKDDQGRYNLVIALHICEKVLQYLQNDVRDAEYAKKQLEDMAKTGRPTIKDKIVNMIP